MASGTLGGWGLRWEPSRAERMRYAITGTVFETVLPKLFIPELRTLSLRHSGTLPHVRVATVKSRFPTSPARRRKETTITRSALSPAPNPDQQTAPPTPDLK